jgi:hypothetical protein
MAQSQHFCVVHVQHNGTYMLVMGMAKKQHSGQTIEPP